MSLEFFYSSEDANLGDDNWLYSNFEFGAGAGDQFITDTTFIDQTGYNMVAITIESGTPRWLNVSSSSATRPNCVDVLQPSSVWKKIPNPSVSGQFSLLNLVTGKYMVLDSNQDFQLVSTTSGYYQYWLQTTIPSNEEDEEDEIKEKQTSQKEEVTEKDPILVTGNPFRLRNAQFSSSYLYQTVDGKNVVMRTYTSGDVHFNFRYVDSADGVDIVNIRKNNTTSWWKCATNSYDLTLQSNPPTNSDPAPYVFLIYRNVDVIMDSYVPEPDPSYINHCGIRGVIAQGGGWCEVTTISSVNYLKVSTNTDVPSLLTTPYLAHFNL